MIGTMKLRKNSATVQVLLALVPYTRQNLMLTFRPTQFFDEMEKTSKYSAATLNVAFQRAKRQKLITVKQNTMSFSLSARQTVQPFIAQQLQGGGKLMVIFDIPEDSAHIRRELRFVLIQLGFKQIQRSVWMSDRDHRQLLKETIEVLDAGEWVRLYEAARV